MTLRRMLPILILMSTLVAVSGCSSQQAAYKTNEVTGQTEGTVDSVLDAVGTVIMYPFHLVGDLFS
jgi:hypothetical protein